MKRFAALGVFAVVAVAVLAFVQLGEPAWLQRLRYPLDYKTIVRAHAHNYRLQPALLAAVIYQESKFDSEAKSSSGAIGLMQLQPATAEGIALRTGGSKFTTADLYDPEINIRYGSWYLRHLLDRYHDVRTALAAYHAGQGNVDEWLRDGGGIQFPETRNYVDTVLDAQRVYADVYGDELGG
jgi:peptidoglycan lytic transglycosylase